VYRRRSSPAARLVVALIALACLALGRQPAALAGRPAAQAQPPAAQRLPNDPLFHLQPYLLAVHAPEAWAQQTGDANVVVAVLDSGIDVTHPDLAPNLWINPSAGAHGCAGDLNGCSFLDPARAPSCPPPGPIGNGDVSPMTPNGTFVAGVIGAAGDNGTGIAGVAWHVSLMAVRVVDCRSGANANTVVAGIQYAVDAGARVIDLSAGSSRAAGAGCRAASQVLADAVQYARDHGVLVVAPAGDDNRPCVRDPAAAPAALAVGGYQTTDGGRWVPAHGGMGSNWGPEVAVAAPANDITSTIPRQPGAQPPNDRYATASGTAFAAALVSGEAALLLSQNPALTPDWLTELIELGAHPRPDGDPPGWAGAGEVDFAASLALVPAAFGGTVAVDGAPAPDGTLVQAFVAGTLCAESATFTQNGVAVYALFVPAAQMTAGCGAPGAIIDLLVNGAPAAQASWQPAAITLNLAAEDVP